MWYKKKPVVVDCFRLGEEPMPRWFQQSVRENNIMNINAFLEGVNETVKIKTLEGVMNAVQGDYIIRGINGEIYPCKPEVFKNTYEYVQLRHIFKQDDLAGKFIYLSEEHYLGADAGDIIIADEDHKIYSEADEKDNVTKIILKDKNGEDTNEIVLYKDGERTMDRVLVPETFTTVTNVDLKKVAYEFLKVERSPQA